MKLENKVMIVTGAPSQRRLFRRSEPEDRAAGDPERAGGVAQAAADDGARLRLEPAGQGVGLRVDAGDQRRARDDPDEAAADGDVAVAFHILGAGLDGGDYCAGAGVDALGDTVALEGDPDGVVAGGNDGGAAMQGG